MDGLSCAVTGFGVVSLGLQLAGGFLKLLDFWGTVRDAPDEVAEIVRDLQLLSRILDDLLKRSAYGSGVEDALLHCDDKIEVLLSIVREFEPNFSSTKPHVRLWSRFKAANKSKKLKRFRDSLQETKFTLILACLPQFQMPPAQVNDALVRDVEATNAARADATMQTSTLCSCQTSNGMEGSSSRNSIRICTHCAPPPSYDGLPEPPFELTPKSATRSPADKKIDWDRIPEGIPISKLQASIEGAFQVAAENYFKGGAFARAMNDTIKRVSTIQTSYRYNGDEEEKSDEPSSKPKNTNGVPVFPPEDDKLPPYPKQRRKSETRILRRTSATGVLFGTVWLRTTTVRVDPTGSANVDVISSFTFFPSRWLTSMGVKYGVEATLCPTPVGWQFNVNPVRAVSEDAAIFYWCKQGNLSAVQQLISDGSASVRDTSPKGLTPLHYAASSDKLDVSLCEFLISEGADKTALAFEGPTEDALCPITMFAATSKKKPAELKINMLRLFEDCIDLSEPSSPGWTVLADLVRAFNQEKVPQTENSVTWFLRSHNSEGMVAFGPKTMWHGLQHAVYSIIDLEQRNNAVEKLLLPRDEKGDIVKNADLKKSETFQAYQAAIAYWTVFWATGKQLLHMLVYAGAILHIEGYDYDTEAPVNKAVLAKHLPFLYTEWSRALTAIQETVDEALAGSLDTALEEAGWTRDSLRELISAAASGKPIGVDHDPMLCSDCNMDYSAFGKGLVEPRWIAFSQCTASKHRFSCDCISFLQNRRNAQLQSQLSSPLSPLSTRSMHLHSEDDDQPSSDDDDDDESDIFHDAEAYMDIKHSSSDVESNCDQDEVEANDDWIAECEKLVQEVEKGENTKRKKEGDPFWNIAEFLYRAQARVWLGKYKAGEMLCGTCFMRREGYIDTDDHDDGFDKDMFGSMPPSFRS